MTYQHSHRSATTGHQPPITRSDIDVLLIDDELDEYLDREIAAIRETLPDYRNF